MSAGLLLTSVSNALWQTYATFGVLVGSAVCGFVIDATGFGPAIGLVTIASLIALGWLAMPQRVISSTG